LKEEEELKTVHAEEITSRGTNFGELAGWLGKQGANSMEAFKKRYFKQNGTSLHYFKDDTAVIKKTKLELINADWRYSTWNN